MILNKTKSPISFRFAAFAIAAALVSLLTTGTLEARLVGQAEAWTVAARLLEFENARPDLRLTHGLFELDRVELMLYHNRPVGYLIRLKPGGFMILADITEVSPQVFVSYEGNPDLLTVIPYLISILDRLEYNKVHLHYLNADGAGDVDADEGDVPDPVMIKRNEQCWSNLGREDIPARRGPWSPNSWKAWPPFSPPNGARVSLIGMTRPELEGNQPLPVAGPRPWPRLCITGNTRRAE